MSPIGKRWQAVSVTVGAKSVKTAAGIMKMPVWSQVWSWAVHAHCFPFCSVLLHSTNWKKISSCIYTDIQKTPWPCWEKVLGFATPYIDLGREEASGVEFQVVRVPSMKPFHLFLKLYPHFFLMKRHAFSAKILIEAIFMDFMYSTVQCSSAQHSSTEQPTLLKITRAFVVHVSWPRLSYGWVWMKWQVFFD